MERRLWGPAPALVCGGKRGKGDDAVVDPLGTVVEWLCRGALRPPPPRVCGTPGGPPVTARRVRLSDGRHLAYEESGVPRETARYRVVFSHGFTGSRLDTLRASQVSHSVSAWPPPPSSTYNATENCVALFVSAFQTSAPVSNYRSLLSSPLHFSPCSSLHL